MGYPVPTLSQLSTFSGRSESTYLAFNAQALAQATLLFSLQTEMTVPPEDTDLASLALNAILQMADSLYLAQPYVPLKAKPFQSETIGSYCVDDSTSILTAVGWKTCDELSQGDVALTLNPVTWRAEWQPVQSVHIFPEVARKVLHVQSKRFSSLSTVEHRWLTEYKGEPYWVTSAELSVSAKHFRIPFNAPHVAPVEAKYSDALVELVAWLWTDGGWSWKGRHRGVRIHQSHRVNNSNCTRIRAALADMFGESAGSLRTANLEVGTCTSEGCTNTARTRGVCTKHYMTFWRSASYTPHERLVTWTESKPTSRPGMTVFSLSAEASETITDHLTYEDKAVRTDFLRSLTHSQLLLFIEVSMLADRSGLKQLAQKNKQCAEQFMLACILAGKRVSIHQQKSGMWQVTHTDCGPGVSLLSVREGAKYGTSSSSFAVETYRGRVWCPKTPNQTWFARREGTMYFTGNTYSMGSGQFRESISFLKAQVGHYTGLIWWDLAMREFGETLQAESSSVQVFERDPVVWIEDATGQRFVKGPSDIMPVDFPFDINSDVGFTDPSGTRG